VVDIFLTDTGFRPQVTVVPPGSTVRWINRRAGRETVTAASGEFESGYVAPGGEFRFTPGRGARIDYYSRIGTGAFGRIEVPPN
jgi:plastocyanin